MSFFKDNADKKELKAKTDRVLQHVKDKITKEEFNRVPYELKSLMYFNSNYDNDYKKLELFLNKMY